MPKVSQSIELIKKSASISVNLCQSKKMQNKPISNPFGQRVHPANTRENKEKLPITSVPEGTKPISNPMWPKHLASESFSHPEEIHILTPEFFKNEQTNPTINENTQWQPVSIDSQGHA